MVQTLPQVFRFNWDEPINIDESLLTSFESLSSFDEVKEFADRMELLPRWDEYGAEDPFSIDDYYCIRDVMRLATRLRGIVDGTVELSKDDPNLVWESCVYHPAKSQMAVTDAPTYLVIPLKGGWYIRFLFGRIMGDMAEGAWIDPSTISADVDQASPGEFAPIAWIDKDDGGRQFLTISIDPLQYTFDLFSTAESYKIACVESLLDQLCLLHLDVLTMTKAGIPFQSTSYAISALWLAMCNRFIGARITTCKACGKPLVVTEERGTPRMYCDDACRKWFSRNKDKAGLHKPASDVLH